MDNIDLQRASELGIKVRNALGTNNISVAELAILHGTSWSMRTRYLRRSPTGGLPPQQDVFSTEPLQPDHPLLALDNFLLTSHIGAFTREAVEIMALVSTHNLLEMLG